MENLFTPTAKITPAESYATMGSGDCSMCSLPRACGVRRSHNRTVLSSEPLMKPSSTGDTSSEMTLYTIVSGWATFRGRVDVLLRMSLEILQILVVVQGMVPNRVVLFCTRVHNVCCFVREAYQIHSILLREQGCLVSIHSA